MGYGVSQSYGFSLPTKSVEGQKLWLITEYGLPELSVKTELTVYDYVAEVVRKCSVDHVTAHRVLCVHMTSCKGTAAMPLRLSAFPM